MDNYLESLQLFQQLPFSFILMRTNDLICFQQLEQNFCFGSKLPDMNACIQTFADRSNYKKPVKMAQSSKLRRIIPESEHMKRWAKQDLISQCGQGLAY